MADAALEKARPNRMSRQRQKTRDRLVNAALSVMASKGVDAATINDITEAADVGFGSFYNHFSSKEEILAVVIKELFERIGTQIDTATGGISDPLEVLAASIRLSISITLLQPEWARFIVRFSAIPGYTEVGLFNRLSRDIRAVEDAGRLHIADPGAAPHAAAGAIVFMINALLEGHLPAPQAPERIAAMVLRVLGANEEEATELANKPLPPLSLRALA